MRCFMPQKVLDGSLFALLAGMLALLSGCAGLSIEELSELAERGDVDAAYDLANAYYAGKHGVSRDHRQAQLWFEKAHRQGHPCAATYVGRIHDEGKFGVQPDQEKALAWYRSGMEGGRQERLSDSGAETA